MGGSGFLISTLTRAGEKSGNNGTDVIEQAQVHGVVPPMAGVISRSIIAPAPRPAGGLAIADRRPDLASSAAQQSGLRIRNS
jgi:hypothetical protein